MNGIGGDYRGRSWPTYRDTRESAMTSQACRSASCFEWAWRANANAFWPRPGMRSGKEPSPKRNMSIKPKMNIRIKPQMTIYTRQPTTEPPIPNSENKPRASDDERHLTAQPNSLMQRFDSANRSAQKIVPTWHIVSTAVCSQADIDHL